MKANRNWLNEQIDVIKEFVMSQWVVVISFLVSQDCLYFSCCGFCVYSVFDQPQVLPFVGQSPSFITDSLASLSCRIASTDEGTTLVPLCNITWILNYFVRFSRFSCRFRSSCSAQNLQPSSTQLPLDSPPSWNRTTCQRSTWQNHSTRRSLCIRLFGLWWRHVWFSSRFQQNWRRRIRYGKILHPCVFSYLLQLSSFDYGAL